MPSSWKKSLKTILASPKSPPTPLKLAILGIGNELNGDDAAGVCLVRSLRTRGTAVSQDLLVLIEAGLAPENFCGALRRFDPQVVLLVDAAEMGAPAGDIQILDWRDTAGFGPSTHLQPLSTLAEYLSAEIGCQVVLVGIQPARLDFDHALSAPVRRAVRCLAAAILEEQPWLLPGQSAAPCFP